MSINIGDRVEYDGEMVEYLGKTKNGYLVVRHPDNLISLLIRNVFIWRDYSHYSPEVYCFREDSDWIYGYRKNTSWEINPPHSFIDKERYDYYSYSNAPLFVRKEKEEYRKLIDKNNQNGVVYRVGPNGWIQIRETVSL